MRSVKNTLFALFLLGVILSGCTTTTVLSNVTVFHELSSTPSDVKYAFVRSPEQQGSLEHKAYEEMIRQQLEKRGFREVPIAQADLAVFLSYQIDDGKTVISSHPIFGQTGVAGSQTYGNIYGSSPGSASYSATTTYTPSFGVVGTQTQSDVVYARKVHLDMLNRALLDQGTASKVYEGKVVSTGSSSQLTRVMPYMIQSLFQDFPGNSGRTRTVELPFQPE